MKLLPRSLWGKKARSRWTPPNDALEQDAFNTRGGYQVWEAVLDMRDRIGKLEGKVEVLLLILVPITVAILGILVVEKALR